MTEEAGVFRVVHHSIGSVLCCKCGIPVTSNAANICVNCLRIEVDITEGLQKHATALSVIGTFGHRTLGLKPNWSPKSS